MSSLRLNLVVAACNNNGIGKNGELPWRLKKDMAFFKKITSETKQPGKQNAVIMGRKTWFSIPERFRPLKGRLNIVLSRELKEVPEGVHIARSLPDAIKLVTSNNLDIENVHIIGGSSVYKEAMTGPYDCRLYLTRIFKDFDCDTFLPEMDESSFEKVKNPEGVPGEKQTENDVSFQFEVYDKTMTSATSEKELIHRVEKAAITTKTDEVVQKPSENTFRPVHHPVRFHVMAAMCHNNRGIGIGLSLPWPSLREDYKRYLRLTSTPQMSDKTRRKIIHINGRRTFTSVGQEEMSLPNVHYIVISPSLKEKNFEHSKVLKVVESFDEAIDQCGHLWSNNELDSVWVMGGRSVYEVALKHKQCDKLYLTHVYKDFPADTYFPSFENHFTELSSENPESNIQTENEVQYEFKIYSRKDNLQL